MINKFFSFLTDHHVQYTVFRRPDLRGRSLSCLELSSSIFVDLDFALAAFSLTLRYLLSRRFAPILLLLVAFFAGSIKSIDNIARILLTVFGSFLLLGVLLAGGKTISRSTISSVRHRGFESDILRLLAYSDSGL